MLHYRLNIDVIAEDKAKVNCLKNLNCLFKKLQKQLNKKKTYEEVREGLKSQRGCWEEERRGDMKRQKKNIKKRCEDKRHRVDMKETWGGSTQGRQEGVFRRTAMGETEGVHTCVHLSCRLTLPDLKRPFKFLSLTLLTWKTTPSTNTHRGTHTGTQPQGERGVSFPCESPFVLLIHFSTLFKILPGLLKTAFVIAMETRLLVNKDYVAKTCVYFSP